DFPANGIDRAAGGLFLRHCATLVEASSNRLAGPLLLKRAAYSRCFSLGFVTLIPFVVIRDARLRATCTARGRHCQSTRTGPPRRSPRRNHGDSPVARCQFGSPPWTIPGGRANLTDKLIGNKIRTSGTSDEKTPKPLYWSNLWLGSGYAL